MKTLTPKTRDAVLQIARWQDGVVESPTGSNKQKYGKAYGVNGVAWCMQFVWWVFREAGFNIYKTASCTTLANRYKDAGQWVTSGYKPGDIVMFDFSGKKKRTQHCGIVIDVADTHIITIEGNTSNTNEANGGCVMQKKRKLNIVTGACRPLYNIDGDK